ncbi:hypothetical protein [Marivivens marinus]|uniref:hypothetical protein n=1 Tax=Marivivens marinus TaxID=3110173 RepID=UPI003B846C84
MQGENAFAFRVAVIGAYLIAAVLMFFPIALTIHAFGAGELGSGIETFLLKSLIPLSWAFFAEGLRRRSRLALLPLAIIIGNLVWIAIDTFFANANMEMVSSPFIGGLMQMAIALFVAQFVIVGGYAEFTVRQWWQGRLN